MKRLARNRASGFTLLEIILAIAILALLSAALIGGATSMLRSKPTSPDKAFWAAVFQARRRALDLGVDVHLSYDAKAQNFVIDDGAGVRTVPVPGATPDLAIDFISVQTDQSTALLGGMAVVTATLPYVTFYSDGTCSQFRVQIHNQIAAHLLAIDPWTCAQVLTPPNPNGT